MRGRASLLPPARAVTAVMGTVASCVPATCVSRMSPGRGQRPETQLQWEEVVPRQREERHPGTRPAVT